MKFRLAILGLVCAVGLPAIAFVERDEGSRRWLWIEPEPLSSHSAPLEVSELTPVGEGARAFLSRHGGRWDFSVDRRTGRADLVSGSGIPVAPGRGNRLGVDSLAGLELVDGAVGITTLEPRVRELIDQNAGLLLPSRGRLVLDEQRSQIRDGGKLASYYYTWLVDDVPVDEATVFVRMNSGNVTQLGAPFVGEIDLDTAPTISPEEALLRLTRYAGDEELARPQSAPDLRIRPHDVSESGIDYRLVWKMRYTIFDRIETWEGIVDAHSGEILGFRDANHYVRAVGGVWPRTVFENNETIAPMPLADVVLGASTVTADAAGGFGYAGEKASSGLNGFWVNTSCQGCSGPAQPSVSTSIGIGRLDFGLGGVDEAGNGLSTRADRNAFFHINQVRRIAKKWLPGVAWIDNPITALTNVNNTCNAVYNGNVNLYRSGGGCNNTGEVADVIYHEWGHGLDLNTNGGDGGTGEGTADVNSMQLTHSPDVGPGFRTNGAPVRDLDASTSSLGVMTLTRINGGDCNILPGGGLSVHCVGQVYGQAAWELSQALVARHGHHTGWRVSERLFYTSLPDADTYVPTAAQSIYSAYINADDDNGNLADGTPNSNEIFEAFRTHEIERVQYQTSAGCSRPTQPVLNVTSACDGFDLSWAAVAGVDHYEVFRTPLRADQAFFPVAEVPAGQTTYTDAEVMPGVDYWYVVMAVDATGCESTIETPQFARLTAQPILSVSAAVADDTPRGNRSGFVDPGEEVDLVLTLENVGEIAAGGVSGTVTPITPGVTLVESNSTFASIAAGGAGSSLDTVRFATDDGLVSCGDVLQFQFVPSESSGCSDDTSYFSVQVGEDDGIGGFVCDGTPACFVEPDFAGLSTAQPGLSCAETDLAWGAASTNCLNATISYNVYRSTDPGFAPGPANLLAQNVSATSFHDTLLAPGAEYFYVVRAFDSRSGEETNTVMQSATAPINPDLAAPIFAGLESLSSGVSCGETVLGWSPALETCNPAVAYEVHRSTVPGFVPRAETLIASTLSTSFVDAALTPGLDYEYVVRSRDGAGNEDANVARFFVSAGIVDLELVRTEFEPDNGGWSLGQPNDASTGTWEWGDPQATSFQPEDDHTPSGVNCWITGLGTEPSNNDVDGGTTTLVSGLYDLTGAVDPVVRYARYFTNDRGGSPGDSSDSFKIDVSNDGGTSWLPVEEIGAGTPLDWVVTEISLNPVVAVNDRMRFRFQTADLGGGSLVEAGIDDFEVFDRDQGCQGCSSPVTTVGTILVDRVGSDVTLDWNADPASGTRYVVYKLGGTDFSQETRIGSSETRSFLHEGAALSGESFHYRVAIVDACGGESALQ